MVFKLDVTKKINLERYPLVFRVNDYPKNVLEIAVTDAGQPLDLAKASISFEGTTSQKTKVIDSKGVSEVKGNTFKYKFPKNAFSVAGVFKTAYFRINFGEDSDTTNDLFINVIEDADIANIDAEDVITDLDNIVDEIVKQVVDETNDKLLTELKEALDKQEELNKLVEIMGSNVSSLDSKVDDLTKLVEESDFFTKDEILQILMGKPVKLKLYSDFARKIAGSEVECPHIFKNGLAINTLLAPDSPYWREAETENYRKLFALDNITYDWAFNSKGNYSQRLISHNILETVKRAHPFLFEGLSEGEQVEKLKKMITRLTPQAWVKGSGPSGNKIASVVFSGLTNKWNGNSTNTTGNITMLRYPLTGAEIDSYIQDDGMLYNLLYADPSDGTTPSSVSLDYTNVETEIEFKMTDFYVSKNTMESVYNEIKNSSDNAIKTSKEYTDNLLKTIISNDVSTFSGASIMTHQSIDNMTGRLIARSDISDSKYFDGFMGGFYLGNYINLDFNEISLPKTEQNITDKSVINILQLNNAPLSETPLKGSDSRRENKFRQAVLFLKEDNTTSVLMCDILVITERIKGIWNIEVVVKPNSNIGKVKSISLLGNLGVHFHYLD